MTPSATRDKKKLKRNFQQLHHQIGDSRRKTFAAENAKAQKNPPIPSNILSLQTAVLALLEKKTVNEIKAIKHIIKKVQM